MPKIRRPFEEDDPHLWRPGRAGPKSQPQRDQYGGYTDVSGSATGYFRLDTQGGRTYLFTPEGNIYWYVGLNKIQAFYSTYANDGYLDYDSLADWWLTQWGRLYTWAFTAVTGPWSSVVTAWRIGSLSYRAPYTVMLRFLSNEGWNNPAYGQPPGAGNPPTATWPDPFDTTTWNSQVDHIITTQVTAAAAADPWLIGWFVGNELDLYWGNITTDSTVQHRWWAHTWAKTLMNAADAQPGRARFIQMLQDTYGTLAAYNAARGSSFAAWTDVGRSDTPPWPSLADTTLDDPPGTGTWLHSPWVQDLEDFTVILADEFFSTVHAAIIAADPNHLVLGCKFASDAHTRVIQALAPYTDVVSLNRYPDIPTRDQDPWYDKMYTQGSNKPVLLTEFGWLQEPWDGIYPGVATQALRGANYATFVPLCRANSHILGYSWHEFVDGDLSADGLNFGLIGTDDAIYTDAVTPIRAANLPALIRTLWA